MGLSVNNLLPLLSFYRIPRPWVLSVMQLFHCMTVLCHHADLPFCLAYVLEKESRLQLNLSQTDVLVVPARPSTQQNIPSKAFYIIGARMVKLILPAFCSCDKKQMTELQILLYPLSCWFEFLLFDILQLL